MASFESLGSSPALPGQAQPQPQPALALSTTRRFWKQLLASVPESDLSSDEAEQIIVNMERSKLSPQALCVQPDRSARFFSEWMPLGTAILIASQVDDHLVYAGYLPPPGWDGAATTSASASAAPTSASVSATSTTGSVSAASRSNTSSNSKASEVDLATFFQDSGRHTAAGLRVVELSQVGKAALLAETDASARVKLYFRALALLGFPTVHAIVLRVFLIVGPIALFKPSNYTARMLATIADILGAAELLELVGTGGTATGVLQFTAVADFCLTAQTSVRSNNLQLSASGRNGNLVTAVLGNATLCDSIRQWLRRFDKLRDLTLDDLFSVVTHEQLDYLTPTTDERYARTLLIAARYVGFRVVDVVGANKQLSQQTLKKAPFAIDCSEMDQMEYVDTCGSDALAGSGRAYVVIPPKAEEGNVRAVGAELLGMELVARLLPTTAPAESAAPTSTSRKKKSTSSAQPQRASSVDSSVFKRPLTLQYLATKSDFFSTDKDEADYAFDAIADDALKAREIRLDNERRVATMADSFKKVNKENKKRRQQPELLNLFADGDDIVAQCNNDAKRQELERDQENDEQ